jgi:hypothetical protein
MEKIGQDGGENCDDIFKLIAQYLPGRTEEKPVKTGLYG